MLVHKIHLIHIKLKKLKVNFLTCSQDAIFSLYPFQDEEEIIERRITAEIPSEHMGHRILVKCLQLKYERRINLFRFK